MEDTMQKLTFVCCVLVLLLLLPAVAPAQGNPVRLAPFGVSNLYLNQQISGDTLANGARRDSNATYILDRNGIYLVNAIIRNTGWTLRIKALDSAGTKPVIFLYPASGATTPPGQMVDIRGNLWLKNLIISGYFEPLPDNLGGLQGSLFNTGAAGKDIVIDSCILTNTNGNHLRTDQAPRLVKVTNTIFANMGYLGRSNLGAGKGIDVRNGSVDSLILLNNTFVNWQDRIIRHYASTANIGYFRFEHNTLVNGMSFHGLLSLGRVLYEGIICNNLLIDAFALGNDSDAVRQGEFTDSKELDQFGVARMTWVIANPNDTTLWRIKNNYYSISTAGQSFWDSASVLPIVANPALSKGSPLTYFINSKLGADSATAFQQTTVALNNIPKLMVAFMKWYRRPIANGGAGKTKGTTGWSAAVDFDRRGFQYFRDTLNCAYSTGLPIYTAATGGYPVGDLNWFPAKLAQWKADPVSAVLPGDKNIPSTFSLGQNYPNPFNPSTHITFALPRDSRVTVEVFDVLGRRVATVFEGVKAVGEHTVDFNASTLSSGFYVYRLTTPEFSAVKKMMLMK
jgi:hypothetical protein